MMNKIVLIAGATGNLGGKIVDALIDKGVKVRAIVRKETNGEKIRILESKGVEVYKVNMAGKEDIAKHCINVNCVISALSGLRDTIIDTQKIILDAAIIAQVPKFIPSDFAIDFTNLIDGQNRNLDLRREFHTYLDKASIKATSIFNGPFMDILTTDMPLILFKKKRILCWGNPNQRMEFTTTFNIAEFTANVALDDDTPRYMRIAGDKLSCNDFVKLLTELTGKDYKLFRPGGIGLLNFVIKATKFFSPANNELYPAWQGMQYMRDMMEGRIIFTEYQNNKYPTINWTTVKEFLKSEKVELK